MIKGTSPPSVLLQPVPTPGILPGPILDFRDKPGVITVKVDFIEKPQAARTNYVGLGPPSDPHKSNRQ